MGPDRDKRAPRVFIDPDKARDRWTDPERAWESAKKGPWGFQAKEKADEGVDALDAPPDLIAQWRRVVGDVLMDCADQEPPLSEDDRAELEEWFRSRLLDVEVFRLTEAVGKGEWTRTPDPESASRALSRLSGLDGNPQSRQRHEFRRALYLEALDGPVGDVMPADAVGRVERGTADATDLFIVQLRTDALENLGDGCAWEGCSMCGGG